MTSGVGAVTFGVGAVTSGGRRVGDMPTVGCVSGR